MKQFSKIMQSFLVISKNRKSGNEYVYKFCKHLKIDNFDISIIDKNEESIGIGDIRNLQSKIFLKPVKSKLKAAIIKNSDRLTTEAQNALLKTLEEPPLSTIIILTARNKEIFLPTITSRCKIIELKEKEDELAKKENTEYLEILIFLSSSGIGERLKIAQDYGKIREEAIAFLEKMITTAHQQIISNINESNNNHNFQSSNPIQSDSIFNLTNILISFQKVYVVIKTTNINPRLALEKLFLDLPGN